MIHPQSLKKGDKIAIVSPAAAIRNHSIIEGAITTLHSWGLESVVTPHCLSRNGYYSGSKNERLSDLLWAVSNDDIKAILCSYGGYGCIHLVEEFAKAIEKNPKWVIGMSDCSVLHAACNAKGIESLHAAQCRMLATEPQGDATTNIQKILFGNRPVYKTGPHYLDIEGHAKGIIAGGNLSVLSGLMRTRYDIFTPGKIIFIEDINEPIYRIERILQNLKLAGILQSAQALIVGEFTDTKEHSGFGGTLYEVIYNTVADCNIPVCFNFPVGHGKRNLPMIEGAEAVIDISKEKGTSLRFL